MAGALSGSTTGSYNLLFYTASVGHEPGHLILSGNMTITGALSASAIHYQDITHIDATGSTFFGNTYDDLHQRTGSLSIWGGVSAGTTPILSASAYSQQTFVRGFGGAYTNVTSSHHTASTFEYILGVTTAGNINITIPSASVFSAGAVLVVKDQHAGRGTGKITLTCSAGAGYTFDNETTYILTGTMPAINLYSNGSNWFVF
tara:strand:- start:2462 stop:3070 length:609 start_codon:yes stop_codon:yes gene_type:complete